ncbi:MAG: hypothetical protein ACKVX7_04060 [Planctomycetota bacterium]
MSRRASLPQGSRYAVLTSVWTCLSLSLASCVIPNDPPTSTAPPSLAEYHTNRDVELSGINVRTLIIQSGSGTLNIVGDPTERRITASAAIHTRARATDLNEPKRIAEEIQLEFRARDTENPELVVTSPRLVGDQSYVAHLTVRMPAGVRLTVVDGAGDIEISNLSEGVNVTSENGVVHIHDVQGGVQLSTGGTKTTVTECTGLIRVADGHGALDVTLVTGDVEVTDTSGELLVAGITGNVLARNNPGSPKFRAIEGDLVLQNISPNDAKVDGVSGSITYPTAAKP